MTENKLYHFCPRLLQFGSAIYTICRSGRIFIRPKPEITLYTMRIHWQIPENVNPMSWNDRVKRFSLYNSSDSTETLEKLRIEKYCSRVNAVRAADHDESFSSAIHRMAKWNALTICGQLLSGIHLLYGGLRRHDCIDIDISRRIPSARRHRATRFMQKAPRSILNILYEREWHSRATRARVLFWRR